MVHDTVKSNELLELLNVKMGNQLEHEHLEAQMVLDEGAEVIGKFVFLAEHLSQYFEYLVIDKGRDPLDPFIDWWHLQDQLSEVWIEALHSLLVARAGLVKQAVYVLRRCYELALFGTFNACTFFRLSNGNEINPFVELSGKGLWIKNIGKKVTLNEISEIVEKIKAIKDLSTGDATREFYLNFTKYYLESICLRYCEEHRNEKADVDGLFIELDNQSSSCCKKCGRKSIYALAEKIVPPDIMSNVVKIKLNLIKDFWSEISVLYDDLSGYMHPNYIAHQHSPNFEIIPLQNWLQFLKKVLKVSAIFYSRGLDYIALKDEDIFMLLEKRKYDLDKMTLKQLFHAICTKVGVEYNKRNPNKIYETEFKTSSYLKE